MSRRGTIFTYSVVHSGTDAFKEKTPYVVALIKEDRQMRIAHLEGYTDKASIAVGTEVEFVTDDEKGNPVYRFLP